MIRFTVDGEDYELDEDRLTFAEGRAIESWTGLAFGEIGEAAKKGSIAPIQALVVVVMKRKTPTLKFSDLDDMAIGDFEFADGDEPDPTDAGEPAP